MYYNNKLNSSKGIENLYKMYFLDKKHLLGKRWGISKFWKNYLNNRYM